MNNQFTNPITEDDIANYLGNTPDFFERHAELLAAVHLSSPHSNRAVSLQERQAEMLREKIKALEASIRRTSWASCLLFSCRSSIFLASSSGL